MKFLTYIDLSKNELQNAVVQNLSTAPDSAKAGQIYFDNEDKLLYVYSGTEWKAVGAPITEIEWNIVKNTPTTIEGYGITDLTLDAEAKALTVGSATLENIVTDAKYVHTDVNFTQVLKDKLDAIAEGAEVNKIDTISVNGKSIAPDKKKNIEITMPTKVSDLTNDKNFIDASGAPVQSVNGETGAVTVTVEKLGAVPTTRTINTHALSEDITLTAADVEALALAGGTMAGDINMDSHKVTGLADATEDTDAVTKKQMEAAIKAVGTVFDFKGAKATKSELPKEKNKIGDVWYVEDEKVGYIWIKDSTSDGRWEQLGPTVDLSGCLAIENLAKTTGSAENTAMTQKATTEALNLKADAATMTEELNKKAEKSVVEAIPVMKVATGTLGTSVTSATVAYTGTFVSASVKTSAGEIVMTDVDVNGSDVIFSVSEAPASALTCIVAYF